MDKKDETSRRDQIYLSFKERKTSDLLSIWEENNKDEWTEEAFDAIREILLERTGTVPSQKEKVTDGPEQRSNTWPIAGILLAVIGLLMLGGGSALAAISMPVGLLGIACVALCIIGLKRARSVGKGKVLSIIGIVIGLLLGTGVVNSVTQNLLARHSANATARAIMEQEINTIFKLMDTDHDGKISRKEWTAFQEKQFDSVDRNHDGYVPEAEIRAGMMEKRHIANATLRGTAEQEINRILQKMDTNHDGKISKKEWMTFQEKQFDWFDRSRDGYISKAEIRAKMMEKSSEIETHIVNE